MTAKRYVRLYELERARSFDELISTLEQSQDVSRDEAIYQAGAKARRSTSKALKKTA